MYKMLGKLARLSGYKTCNWEKIFCDKNGVKGFSWQLPLLLPATNYLINWKENCQTICVVSILCQQTSCNKIVFYIVLLERVSKSIFEHFMKGS